MFKRKVRNSAK